MTVLKRNSKIIIEAHNSPENCRTIGYEEGVLEIKYECKDGVFYVKISYDSSVKTCHFALSVYYIELCEIFEDELNTSGLIPSSVV